MDCVVANELHSRKRKVTVVTRGTVTDLQASSAPTPVASDLDDMLIKCLVSHHDQHMR